MTLEEYLAEKSISVADFAVQIGAKSRMTVYRYMKDNKKHRVPNPKMMLKIMKVTGGLIGPADFYPKQKFKPAVMQSNQSVNTV